MDISLIDIPTLPDLLILYRSFRCSPFARSSCAQTKTRYSSVPTAPASSIAPSPGIGTPHHHRKNLPTFALRRPLMFSLSAPIHISAPSFLRPISVLDAPRQLFSTLSSPLFSRIPYSSFPHRCFFLPPPPILTHPVCSHTKNPLKMLFLGPFSPAQVLEFFLFLGRFSRPTPPCISGYVTYRRDPPSRFF